jgi:hypothetical protein
MKNAVFWDMTTQFVLHRRHYVSATESSLLMLCKIWCVHGSDYEERRLPGYYSDDGGYMFLRNVGSYKSYTV